MKRGILLGLIFLSFCAQILAQQPWTNLIPSGHEGSPIVREYHNLAALVNSSLGVLFSGVTYNGTTYDVPDTWVIDFATYSWIARKPSVLPTPRGYYSSVATSKEVIIFGGRTESIQILSDVWRYEVNTNVWTQDTYAGNVSAPIRTFHSGVLIGNILYVFGGYAAELFTSSNDLWAYDISTKTWSLLIANGATGSPPPRQGHTATAVNDRVLGPGFIIFGGYTGRGGLNDAWRYTTNNNRWQQINTGDSPLPPPRFGHTAAGSNFVAGDSAEVVIFGGDYVGDSEETYHNDVWSLKVTGTNGAWKNLVTDGNTQGPWRRAGHASAKYNGLLFTFGGYGQFVGLYNDLWRLNYEF